MKPSPEQRAFDASRRVHKQLRGRTITIKRGSNLTLNVVVTLGFTGEQNFEGEAGFAFGTEFRQYLIDVADYVVDGEVVEPEMHDEFIEVINGKTVIFEVLQDGGATEADHDDTNRTFWRVHTKEK